MLKSCKDSHEFLIQRESPHKSTQNIEESQNRTAMAPNKHLRLQAWYNASASYY